MSQHTLQRLTCETSKIMYRADVIADEWYRNRTNKDRFEFNCSNDGGVSWASMPLRLDWPSSFKNILFRTWPPQMLCSLAYNENSLILEYIDPWVMFQKPILPFSLDRESRWRAHYNIKQKQWHLERLRVIRYDK